MTRNVIQVDPDKFPWLDLRRYTFSLGTEKDGVVYVSGHTASAYDKTEGHVSCKGNIGEQSKVAWEKIGVVLEAAGMRYDNIVRAVDYVAPPGLADFELASSVRQQYMGNSPVASTSVIVHSLLRPDALIEVNVIAAKGDKEAVVSSGAEFERLKDLAYAPAVKVGNKVWLSGVSELESDDTVDPAENCYYNIEKVLDAAGASFSDVINTMNYLDPKASSQYPDTRNARERHFEDRYPASSSMHCHGLLSTKGHLAVELTAVVDTVREEIIPPGWDDAFREMAAAPAVKQGNLLYISGQSSVDWRNRETQLLKHDLVEQARRSYQNVAEVCATAGIRVDDIMYTLECTPPATVNDVRGLGQVRREVFGDVFPAATGLIIPQHVRTEQLFQVIAVAVA